MQRAFSRTRPSSNWLSLAVFVLFILTLVLATALPPSSKAIQERTPATSQKRTRPEFIPGEALVRYRSERIARRQELQTLISSEGRQLSVQVERFEGSDLVPGLRLARVSAADTLVAIEALKNQPDVLYAEPNFRWYAPAITPNDPCFPANNLPGCHSLSLYGLSKIGAPLAWDTIRGSRHTPQAGFGTPQIVVGVVDEGVDVSHQDLAANIWINPGETPGDSIDNDGNGFVDDVNGYNFFDNTGAIPAANHSTHVAGIVGAVGDNGVGVVGVNWQVGLMSLKTFGSGGGSTADNIRAAAYAKQMRDLWLSSGGSQGANVRVLNNSWSPNRRFGNGFSPALFDTINAVGQSGILFVAAAGNDAIDNDVDPGYPGSFNLPNLISVASTDQNDGLSLFSNFGSQTITMGAPGQGILSTTLANTYSSSSGTSMSAPHVAGAAALLLAANPNLTMAQLKGLLIFNGDLVASLSGKTITGRRLNVATSVQTLAENDTTPPGTVTNFHINSQVGRSLNLGWIASGDDGPVGQASLYELRCTDTTTSAVIFHKSLTPAAPGAAQATDVKLPYRHTSATCSLREFDNSGNEGVPATLNVSVSLLEADPYLTSVGSSAPLSVGGSPQNLLGDDKLKLNFALPFSFPFFGENFTTVNFSTNGNLFFSTPPTRSNGDADDVPSSLTDLTKHKMISGLWDDLRTDRSGGDVFVVTPDASRIIFRWQAVTFEDVPANEVPVNFEIELRSNGTILTRYGTGQSAPTNTNLMPVVGISAGEPDTYVIPSHTSEQALKTLTNAGEVTFLPRALATVSSVQFSTAQFDVSESSSPLIATVSVTRSGDTSNAATVDYATSDASATQKGDYILAVGRLSFAAGETTKNISVLIVNDAFPESTESFSVTLSNPIGTIIGARVVAAVAITDNDASAGPNPLDNVDALFFVRQHYLDFLNREPDAPGLAFWAGQITECGSDPGCLDVRRTNVSAAFFLSIEFQETGYLVYKMYKAAYGNMPGAPVPITYGEFLPDSQQIAEGVEVGIGPWQTTLENNKVAFANDFVTRTRFSSAHPATLTPAQFVDALILKAGFTPTAAERQAFIDQFGPATDTANTVARAGALRAIAENGAFHQQELNRAFVLMEYFGYLRRNPFDPPELTLDYAGYNFWLQKLNDHGGDFQAAQMVKSFIVSGEYRARFGP